MIRQTLDRLRRKRESGAAAVSYAEATHLVRSNDPQARRAVALDPHARPELLYFLARDISPAVRAAVAAHPATPRQADLLLAVDEIAEIRTLIAEKVTAQIRSLPRDDVAQIWQLTVSILEALARDDLTRVRQLLAETVRGLEKIPRDIAITLAGDTVPDVAVPALHYPGGLPDAELVDIVRRASDPSIIAAVAQRHSIGADVAEAVVAHGDEISIAALLGNRSAALSRDTLERVIERAPNMPSWHAALVKRPELTEAGARRLSDMLSNALAARPESGLGTALHQRVAATAAGDVIEPEDGAPARARLLEAQRALTEDMVIDALSADLAFAVAALALRARIAPAVVRKIFRSHSAKGLVSLAWRAGFGMRLALQLQTRIGRLPPKSRLIGSGDGWPLPADEMTWQIEFFRTLVPGA